MTKVTTATEWLSLCLGWGWAWLGSQLIPWGLLVLGKGSICWSEEPGTRWGAMAGVRPGGDLLLTQGLSTQGWHGLSLQHAPTGPETEWLWAWMRPEGLSLWL